MTTVDTFLDWISRQIASRISCAPSPQRALLRTDVEVLAAILEPGDVLLIDGCDKVSAAIRYLTQSSWSHAALYVGELVGSHARKTEPHSLVEMNLGEGCVAVPLSKYAGYSTRLCRPHKLSNADRRAVARFMIDRIGLTYDTRNVFDLARYLIPHPPVPQRWRRRMLAFGSGDPTRAICSTLIAQAFQSVRYPILPEITRATDGIRSAAGYTADEIFHIRHHSLFTPRDFDLSPYFEIVKPALANGFEYTQVTWSGTSEPESAASFGLK
jgi:hypothetical protein